MSRTLRAGWACALAVLAAGCQDYNFNPVGHCVIQPGTKRFTLSSISSADVLFVVDDSGSMGEEQAALATNFSRFIANLDASNVTRVNAGLEPFDFHIAVSTTSLFWNPQTAATCTSSCPGATGLVCCGGAAPVRQPRRCTSDAQCTVANTACRTSCNSLKGESYCCAADGSFPAGSLSEVIPCSREGTACGGLETHYGFASCDAGVAVDQWPFPKGDFVSWTSGSTANPRVLHFDKELYTGTANKQGFTRAQLVSFFSGSPAGVNANVMVGTCGSGEEQALNAAKRAIDKALGRDPSGLRQMDTYARAGTGTPLTPVKTWDGTTRIASSPADWLASASSKLVVVFVGDEDDCSSPDDPSAGVVMISGQGPGADACNRDASTDPPLGHKEYTVPYFADYFMSLGRPVGAAFIFPAAQDSCNADTCTAGPGVCSTAQAPGFRLLSTAQELRARGAEVVLGSICDPNFGDLLDSIADIVKPPSGLTLPTLPAAGEVTLLRIANTDGQTRKVCSGPLAPGSYTLQQAQATGTGWWFAADSNPGPPVAGPTTFVYINPQGDCIANPGETYSADYLGKLPSGGCWDDPSFVRQGAETYGDAMCRSTLGGVADSWTCFADSAGACGVPTQAATGTCICGSRASNCTP